MKEIDLNQENEAFTKNDAFEKKVLEKGGNKAAIGRNLGNVSGQLIGQYINGRQRPKEEFFKKWEKSYGENIRPLFETNVSHGIDTTQKTDSPITMEQLIADNSAMIRTMELDAKARAHDASARERDSKIRESLVETNKELVRMIKGELIASASQQIHQDVQTKLGKLLGFVALVGSGKRWKTLNEALAAINSEIDAPENSHTATDTHNNVHMKNK